MIKNKLKILLVIGVTLSSNYFISSCTTTKNTLKEEKEMVKVTEPNFNMSNQTKFFLKDLEKELISSNTTISEFSPSEVLKSNYNLKQIDAEYFISGMIKIEENFEKETIDKLGVKYGLNSSSIFSVNIPLKKIYDFLQLENVNYFQISEKVNTK